MYVFFLTFKEFQWTLSCPPLTHTHSAADNRLPAPYCDLVETLFRAGALKVVLLERFLLPAVCDIIFCQHLNVMKNFLFLVKNKKCTLWMQIHERWWWPPRRSRWG